MSDPIPASPTPSSVKEGVTPGSLLLGVAILLFFLGASYVVILLGTMGAVLGAGGTMSQHVFAERFAWGAYAFDAVYVVVYLLFLASGRPYTGIGVGFASGFAAGLLAWVIGFWVIAT